jgi:hypothetical protein
MTNLMKLLLTFVNFTYTSKCVRALLQADFYEMVLAQQIFFTYLKASFY